MTRETITGPLHTTGLQVALDRTINVSPAGSGRRDWQGHVFWGMAMCFTAKMPLSKLNVLFLRNKIYEKGPGTSASDLEGFDATCLMMLGIAEGKIEPPPFHRRLPEIFTEIKAMLESETVTVMQAQALLTGVCAVANVCDIPEGFAEINHAMACLTSCLHGKVVPEFGVLDYVSTGDFAIRIVTALYPAD